MRTSLLTSSTVRRKKDSRPNENNRIKRGALENDVHRIEHDDTVLTPGTTYYYILVTAHGGTTTSDSKRVRTLSLEVPVVEFPSAPARAAAGHKMDDVHTVTVTGVAKRTDATTGEETIAANEQFTLTLDENQGAPDKAAYIKMVAGQPQFVETLDVTSDAQGKISASVLSSDKITSSIKVKAQWRDPNQPNSQLQDAGDKALDFAAVESKRRFGLALLNEGSESDTGWDFNPRLLINAGDRTGATVYLKFRKNPNAPVDNVYFLPNGNPRATLSDAANWLPVNNHTLRISIEEITGFGGSSSPTLSPLYVYFADSQGRAIDQNRALQPIDDPAAFSLPPYIEIPTGPDGTATVYLKAGPLINQCGEIRLKVVEMTQK